MSDARRPKVVSLFSGAGGLDLGLAAAGFDILFESDIDGPSCATLRKNGSIARERGLLGFENTVVSHSDVYDLSGDAIRESTSLQSEEIDLLAGGPPCQAFSISGLRAGVADKRGLLVFEYARLLSELKPKAFVFENVFGLLTIDNGKVFQEVLRQLANTSDGVSYRVQWQRVNARDYLVPQSRDRVIITGVRADLSIDDHSPLVPLASEDGTSGETWRTVRQALVGLPVPESRTAPTVANHYGRTHGAVVTERYSRLLPGERDSKTRINRLDLNRPSYTIVVGSDAGGGKGHVHPLDAREITPRESARMQTFPDWWEFEGGVRDAIRQVGNAVPTVLGLAIGRHLLSEIFDGTPQPVSDGISLLGQAHLLRANVPA